MVNTVTMELHTPCALDDLATWVERVTRASAEEGPAVVTIRTGLGGKLQATWVEASGDDA